MKDKITKVTKVLKSTSATATETKKIVFRCQADQNSQVFVAGTFNEWNPKKHKLKYNDGIFTGSVSVPKGRHEYKFVVNDTWCLDPDCTEWTPNGLGSLNSVVVIN